MIITNARLLESHGQTQSRILEADGTIYLQRLAAPGSKTKLGTWRDPRKCTYHDGVVSHDLEAKLLDVAEGVGFSAKWIMICLIAGEIVTLRSIDDGEEWTIATDN